jgi:hypothetical protein
VPEFISYAKSNPGKVSYGSGGIGTSIHVASELFKLMAGIDMIHVPYRGGAPAMTDLMGGQIQVVFNPVPESMEHIKAGKLRPLAVTGATRSEALPDVPTVGDFVPGFEASALQGIGAPKDTPALSACSASSLRLPDHLPQRQQQHARQQTKHEINSERGDLHGERCVMRERESGAYEERRAPARDSCRGSPFFALHVDWWLGPAVHRLDIWGFA